MARRHLRAFKRVKGARVLAISGRNETALRAICSEFGVKNYYTDLESLLTRNDIDAIDVVTPTYTHESIVTHSLLSGRHVLCEKPIALTLAEADRMLSARRSAGKILMIGFPLRFSPEFVHAKQLIAKGVLGDIKVAWFRSARPLPVQRWYHDKDKSGGVAAELAIHFIDCLRWLIGSEAESVIGEATGDIYGLGKEDNIWAIYRFLNGAIGVIGSSYSFNSFDDDGGIIGNKLSLRFQRSRAILSDYRKKETLFSIAARDYISGLFIPFILLKDFAIITELQHFVDCVRNNTQPEVTGEEARRTLELVIAALQAAKTGQRVKLF